MIDPRSLARLSGAQSRSISPENFDGAKGGGARATQGTGAAYAAHLGPGWKISPSVDIDGYSTFELAAIDGPALITHMWLTTHRSKWRSLILRAYWDSADGPAIEVPLGDFFGAENLHLYSFLTWVLWAVMGAPESTKVWSREER